MKTPRLSWRRALQLAFLGGAAAGIITGTGSSTWAADHNDPVRVQATGTESSKSGDPAADIADIFTWYTGDLGRKLFSGQPRIDSASKEHGGPYRGAHPRGGSAGGQARHE
jgi:hypothetical protein